MYSIQQKLLAKDVGKGGRPFRSVYCSLHVLPYVATRPNDTHRKENKQKRPMAITRGGQQNEEGSWTLSSLPLAFTLFPMLLRPVPPGQAAGMPGRVRQKHVDVPMFFSMSTVATERNIVLSNQLQMCCCTARIGAWIFRVISFMGSASNRGGRSMTGDNTNLLWRPSRCACVFATAGDGDITGCLVLCRRFPT